jgi:hypothetical protein
MEFSEIPMNDVSASYGDGVKSAVARKLNTDFCDDVVLPQ